MTNFLQKLARKKYIDPTNVTDTKLLRCLTTLDLTALGLFTYNIYKRQESSMQDFKGQFVGILIL